MPHTDCACGHKGFYLLTDRLVLWYLTGHDSLQLKGEIVSSEGGLLTILPTEEAFDGGFPRKPFTIEKREDRILIVEAATKYFPAADYSLKRTYLGPEIRERVEKFRLEEWKASQEEH